jgi:hypothetical protein
MLQKKNEIKDGGQPMFAETFRFAVTSDIEGILLLRASKRFKKHRT